MASLMDALNLIGNRADAEAKKPKPSPSPLNDPAYRQKNKADIAKTFETSPENDYNAKIKKALGF